MENLSTPIQKYFGNSTIFVVGASGLLGSLLIEKLLRTCKDLKKIYILLRNKKGISSEDRFRIFFDRPLFKQLKLLNPEILNKVVMVSGDCSVANLGLSEKDLENLTAEVNCIFYCAANINFEEKFRKSVTTNTTAVQDLLNIAKATHDLKSIVYVSTAFFYGLKQKEVVYERVDDANNKLPEQLQTLCDNFNDDQLQKFKTILIDKPTTTIYATTKWAAEILINKIGEGLPVAVIRPSLITPTLSDPIPGWIDNYYAAIGFFTNISLGLFRVVLCRSSYKLDMIPADYVINCMIAAAWNISKQNHNDILKIGETKTSTIKIYNCITSVQNPITYGKATDLFLHYYRKMPCSKQMFYDKPVFVSNVQMYYILKYILYSFPAHTIEFLSYCMLKPTKITTKINKLLNHYERIFRFAICDWNIRDDNFQMLWQNLDDEDKLIYNFDISKINWNLYFKSFVEGVRVYLLKDPMETVPKAIKRRLKLKIIFYFATALIIFGLFWIAHLCLNV